MFLRFLPLVALVAVLGVACNEDDDGMVPCDVTAGTISGGPFAFTLDGLPDAVEGISVDGASGELMVFIVTDADGMILAFEPTLEALAKVDFDPNGVGSCFIYHMSFQRGVLAADAGNNLTDITGCFELSNGIEVVRNPCETVGGTLAGSDLTFTIDEESDFIDVGDLAVDGATGDTLNYVLTAPDSTIIALYEDADTLSAVDFNSFAAGDYLLWALSRITVLAGAEPGKSPTEVAGCFGLSEPVSLSVSCPASGGSLEGGPFVYNIDGEADFLEDDDLALTGEVGDTMTYVVTDTGGVILALPGDYAGLQSVDFDGAGTGRCLIWHLSYSGKISGAAVGANANDLSGCFSLSNPIIVERVCTATGGKLSGSSFSIVVDSIPDTVASLPPDTINTELLVLSGAEGQNTTYVVTDADGIILGLPGDLEALGQVNFDAAGPGTCLIWHLSFNGSITGAEVGANATAIQGCWDLSNPIEVVRTLP